MRQEIREPGSNAALPARRWFLSRHTRARSYAVLGAVLSQGAPTGALALHALVDPGSVLDHLAQNVFLYAYMSVSTCIAFSIFGYRLGSVADDLLRQRRALRKANHRLKRLSEVDPLTRLLNRRSVDARLRSECQRSQRDGSPLAILMLDLDHFKRINDLFGHRAGDQVLRGVGRHLRRLARSTDSVGRIGGEEFLIVLPATGTPEAMGFAERLRAAIETESADPSTPPITASLGVIVVVSPDPFHLEKTLRQLDEALYRAKAEGRNRVSLSPASQ